MNSKQKGNIGIGMAIAHFTKLGLTVSLPLTDSQDYDIIVDIYGALQKVQVKYTASKATSNHYIVPLRSISGTTRKIYKTIIETDIDILFIYSEDGNSYCLSINDLSNVNMLTLNEEFKEKYLIK